MFVIENDNKVAMNIAEIGNAILKHKANNTYELMNANVMIVHPTDSFFKKATMIKSVFGPCKFMPSDASRIIVQATCGNKDAVIGRYRIDKYVDAFRQLQTICEMKDAEKLFGRQMVITFEKEHCFQHIQFLARDNQVNVIVSMRSCNFIENFLYDVYIASIMGVNYASRLEELGYVSYNAKNINIILQIGSLHIFDETRGFEAM